MSTENHSYQSRWNCSSDTQITQRKPDYAELPSQYTPQDGQASTPLYKTHLFVALG